MTLTEFLYRLCFILGPDDTRHAHPAVVRALKAAVAKGTSYGAPTALEIELAELVLKIYPSMDKVRMVNSGTEATMSAIRAARDSPQRQDYKI